MIAPSDRRRRRIVLLSTVGMAFAIVLASAVIPGYAASLAVGSGRLSIFKPTNLPCSSPGSQTVTAIADSWVLQSSPSSNNGTDLNLYVQSQSGSQNRRTFVRFTLPSVPAGCAVTASTLRLFANSTQGTRVITARRASASWTETGITWSNQPAPTGTTATSASGLGWRTWNAITQVQAMYAGSNFGFVVRDQTESASGGFAQNYASREDSPNDPELIVTWG